MGSPPGASAGAPGGPGRHADQARGLRSEGRVLITVYNGVTVLPIPSLIPGRLAGPARAWSVRGGGPHRDPACFPGLDRTDQGGPGTAGP
jgi:hypothetical protein